MKNLKSLIGFVLLIPVLAMAQGVYNYPLDVEYDESEALYYVSNWGGQGSNDHGYILKVNTSGEILSTLFSDLSYAGGLCLIDDVLYVTDNTDLYQGSLPSYLVVIDVTNGDEIDRVEISSGGTYLDFVEADNSGNLYIGDSEKQCIYKYNIATQEFFTFITGINKPFGICFDDIEDRLLYTESKSEVSRIWSISTDGGEATKLYSFDGWMEGLVMNDEGEYFFTSWKGNGVEWGNEQVYKLNHALDGWKYELSNDQNRPFGLCLGHDDFLVICNWGSDELIFLSLIPYGTGENALQPENLSVYPNPGNGNFKVRIPALNANEASMSVVDLHGKVITSRSIDRLQAETEIALDLTFLPSGIYILLLQDGGQVQREKLIVQ